MRYWGGSKRVISTKAPGRQFKKSPKLSVKEEMKLVLLRLRLALTNELIADCTWIKFLAEELHPLVYWPGKEKIMQNLPKPLKNYSNLRCTIDCSEVFIDRPRHLQLQALAWSDYKKHNTMKFLVGIAPNGTD